MAPSTSPRQMPHNLMHTQRHIIGQHELDHVFEEKDLGVTFDSDLKFDKGRESFTFLDCAQLSLGRI